MRTFARCVASACVALATAASAADQPSAALESARARWEAAALADYEYGYRKFCECHRESPPETVVTVDHGKVVRVRHRPAGVSTEVPAEDRNVQYYWTMPELFALVAGALERGATVRADYDPTLGFPTSLYIDYDASFIGDELDLRLTGVVPLDCSR